MSAFNRCLLLHFQAYNNNDLSPLGGGAIAGTSFPIDRTVTRDLMGFKGIQEHCLDATGNRDAFLEAISAAAILTHTTSRLADEMIMWSSFEFRSITLDDGFAMGSSMMPQKKNPVCFASSFSHCGQGPLELIRGRTGRMYGYLVAGLTMMKGLPSGYNRDFHEDKEIVYRSLRLAAQTLEVIPALIQSTTLNKERMHQLAYENFASATELANTLVRRGIPFRQAHHIVGTLVGDLTRSGRNFSDLKACHAHLQKNNINMTMDEVKATLEPADIVKTYNSLGGTSPKAVKDMLVKMT
jgi:argininosuccinate lyase